MADLMDVQPGAAAVAEPPAGAVGAEGGPASSATSGEGGQASAAGGEGKAGGEAGRGAAAPQAGRGAQTREPANVPYPRFKESREELRASRAETQAARANEIRWQAAYRELAEQMAKATGAKAPAQTETPDEILARFSKDPTAFLKAHEDRVRTSVLGEVRAQNQKVQDKILEKEARERYSEARVGSERSFAALEPLINEIVDELGPNDVDWFSPRLHDILYQMAVGRYELDQAARRGAAKPPVTERGGRVGTTELTPGMANEMPLDQLEKMLPHVER